MHLLLLPVSYYLVTDGLRAKYPLRVRDFPPDETSLIGAAIGYSQSGLVPIVEIPYCKYLDCAYDMFSEAVIANWLSDGKQPNGMIIRIQGFDKGNITLLLSLSSPLLSPALTSFHGTGIFGGNYHTHNCLPLPPGLDVVCYSNGADYVRGMRFAFRQAAAGRVVMSVDSTDLLNRRHLQESSRDDLWMSAYPLPEDELTFDSIIAYHSVLRSDSNFALNEEELTENTCNIVICTYGNGVPVALNARSRLLSPSPVAVAVAVLDVPCLSRVPAKLREYLSSERVHGVVFADVCKSGAGMPLGGMALQLHSEGILATKKWVVVGAAPTYNPLGSSISFLNDHDVLNSLESLSSELLSSTNIEPLSQ